MKKIILNERDLRFRAGWTGKTRQHKRYIHYDEDAVNEKILKNKDIDLGEDIEMQKEKDKILEPKVCTRCKSMFPNNREKWLRPATDLYCGCGQPLDKTELKRFDDYQEDSSMLITSLMNQKISTTPSKDHYDALFNTIVENPLFLNKMKEIFDKNEFEKLGNDI